jgi:aspartyl-tRNA(Asn)/glutamyl-tRNA(Gln) amidotransferase subunit A
LHSFIRVTADLAMEQAATADSEMAAGVDRGPLHGVPIGLKDLFATRAIPTTAHSNVLIDWVPSDDSAVTASLQSAGAVLLGKLAKHEFAAGKPGPDLPFPAARNPWNLEHIPGGSSSGSGAALAAGFCFGAMGSDTGGSIRGPAAFCGIAGIKPTFGRVSRRGVVPLSWSFDHAGPMARGVEDCAFLLQAISGFDPLDPASARVSVPDFARELESGVQGLRLGVPRDWLAFGDGIAPEVAAAFEAALVVLKDLGATLVDVPSPAFIDSEAANLLVGLTEAFSYHRETLRTRRGEFSKNLKDQFLEGAFISGADYVLGQRATVAIRSEIAAILDTVDAIVSPTAATVADRFDAEDPEPPVRRPGFTNPANVTGFPAISVPNGMASGLPIGLQIMARAFDEALVLRVAKAFEASTDWHTMHPPL